MRQNTAACSIFAASAKTRGLASIPMSTYARKDPRAMGEGSVGPDIGLDSAPVIYFIEDHPVYSSKLTELFEAAEVAPYVQAQALAFVTNDRQFVENLGLEDSRPGGTLTLLSEEPQ